MSGYRLADGGLVDRATALSFTFDGKRLDGFAGDTLASALIANGVTLVGRSFKYHRPRGILSAGTEEPNALMTLGEGSRAEPNIPATTTELFEGLVARSQNRWPSLGLDLLAATRPLAPMLVAGFYYKTFMGPTKRSWMLFEPFIRRAAGLGAPPTGADPDCYDRRNHFCDVLIVGGGPAGIAAALQAARSGARVTLADDAAAPGGALRGSRTRIDGEPAGAWLARSIAELDALGATRLPRTTVFGYYDHQTLGAVERVTDHLATTDGSSPRQRYWIVRARHVVLCAGAVERPLVFPGNDRPGVMLADAVRLYAYRHGVACGRKVALFTNNDSAYGVVRDLSAAGAPLTAVIDARAEIPEACRRAAHDAGVELIAGSVVRGTHGGRSLSALDIGGVGGSGTVRRLDVDCLAVSGGWTPRVHLASQMGGPPTFDARLQSFLPGAPSTGWIAAGAMAGTLETAGCLAEGADAGDRAARAVGLEPTATPDIEVSEELTGYQPLVIPAIRGRGKAFVDLQNDVAASDVELARREGYVSVEHLKRYTTLGMATDQGKTSNVNAIALMAEGRAGGSAEVGTTRFRAPYTPVTLGALAGRHTGAHFQAERRTPMHDWHVANGAVMSPVGPWLRPRAYLRAGETLREAYIREAGNVREQVGVCDVSTLGKIDIQGPDAGKFLNRVYSNGFKTLAVGKARYGVMLRDDGMLLDDGTTWRLDETAYLMTTTTGAAAPVMQHLERLLNVAWPNLQVNVTSTTSHWASMSLAGPRARDVLADLLDETDVSGDALPFMAVRRSSIAGVPVIVARLSFSGELAYEIFCGAGYGLAAWRRVLEVGAAHGIMPYGTEALGTLRIEKGHIAGGEMDGRISPHHVGLAGMLSKRKPYFGSALANRDGLLDPERYEIVGLVSRAGEPLRAGAHVVSGPAGNPGPSQGFISSTTFSPALGKEIALALVKGGDARRGEVMYAADPVHRRHLEVDVVSPHFHDPDGTRMKD